MSSPIEMLERLEAINLKLLAGDVLQRPEVKHQYNQLNREQMWDGKDSQGKDLSPNYYTDPYFKTRQQSERYIEWKQRITPNPRRRPEVPNLFINGHYYNSMDYQIVGVFILYTNNWNEGIDIDRKFPFVRGLAPLSKKEFWERIFRDELLAELYYALKLY